MMPFVGHAVDDRHSLVVCVLAAAVSPLPMAALTFLIMVRTTERRLALWMRRFSAWRARFFACGGLAADALPHWGQKFRRRDYSHKAGACQPGSAPVAGWPLLAPVPGLSLPPRLGYTGAWPPGIR